MNLLHEPWMPVRLSDGRREWIAPSRLSDPAVVAFDADRADFNGALAQFAIGLLQTCSPAQTQLQWKRLFENPPDADTLQEWFEPHSSAFVLDGDGARFMQDFELRTGSGETIEAGGLLVGFPIKDTADHNKDHFIKHDRYRFLCPHCAALALFTKQVTGQAGGRGYRTGLRGGGPLTTLLIADPESGTISTLWSTLWLNVVDQGTIRHIGGDDDLQDACYTFPWMSNIRVIQRSDEWEVSPSLVHPMHAYWGMQNRIRLDFEQVSEGDCGVCSRPSERLIQKYVTRNYGFNYKGPWRHPLSPYYKGKDGMLPVHAQPGGLGYQHWLGLVLGSSDGKDLTEPALVVSDYFSSVAKSRSGVSGFRLWAAGYDIENAKTRCWYEATMPLYDLTNCDTPIQSAVREVVTTWINGASLASGYLVKSVKDAWFKRDARGKFDHIDASFWSRTEGDFYRLLQLLISAARSDSSTPPLNLSGQWIGLLQKHVMALFETEWVGTGMIERQNPARVAKARKELRDKLYGPKLRAALALKVEAKPAKKKPGKANPATKSTQ